MTVELKNISRLLAFAKGAHGDPLTLAELEKRFSFAPDGTNFYYGLNAANRDNFQATGNPFNPTHQSFFDDLLENVATSATDEKTLMLGVEPSQPNGAYEFVEANKELVRGLARGLADLREEAFKGGKRLNIAIRYASEMNDHPRASPYSAMPDKFRASFVSVRSIFRELAPAVLFSFSPALRVDLPEAAIAQYWPGDDQVDIIGGTWYVGDAADVNGSFGNMQAYFRHRVGTGKAFAISELGGCQQRAPTPGGNDAMLRRMLHELEALDLHNVSFKYVTLFLESKWGTDATLAFLSNAGTGTSVA